jgi:hypothetical protein
VTADDVAHEWAAQGLPPVVEDLVVLDRVAALIVLVRGGGGDVP